MRPLPLDLAMFGFPGCFMNVGYDKTFGLVSRADSHFTVPVQANVLGAGARIYSQIVVPESKGTRIAASQGYEMTMQKSVNPLTVAVIPDTQNYVVAASWASNYNAMTAWIVGNLSSNNIVFVSHVGDIVNDGSVGLNKNKIQWDRAQSAMLRFDGNLSTKPDGFGSLLCGDRQPRLRRGQCEGGVHAVQVVLRADSLQGPHVVQGIWSGRLEHVPDLRRQGHEVHARDARVAAA